ncbi:MULTISPECIES: aldo/keto reductase [unclassified Oceanispirochaeta]|uniref:aldo/keto reductase n=1 Tax=unclassified Oceanispirochaeta TaxID=2635722 RepID=UPI000E095581|nr:MULTISPECIES: aldo/keto reductase [unclassified Oceanispirochaeta]MBF9014791.1 aldo/keto reductase [Oceanispirochaeta sp. M2]NPD71047.1 aldo/keto reductase [Oceanispirochaeta sp. M1]RDG33880.1 aldo/keto reductase [Oceanispirochaeta sp. M1]
MKKKFLGNSDIKITPIGLGTWAIGGSWAWGWGEQEDEASIKTIHAALEKGINWVDTAPAYGLGNSEIITARAIRESSYDPYIFTKCGIRWNEKGETDICLEPKFIAGEFENSLRRMKLETIDLYQVHWPTDEKNLEGAWTLMADYLKQGKIRALGVSNFSVEQMELVSQIAPITTVQPPYSLIFPEVEKEILPYCSKHNIGVINYSPMASGLLSGKMSKERITAMDDTDWRKKSEHFKEPKLSKNLALADLLADIGTNHNCTAGEVAIAWTLHNPAITGAIVGMRAPSQVDGVIHAGEVELSSDELKRIADASA